MNATDEQLQELERLAASMLTLADICVVMEWQKADLKRELADELSPVYRAYWKGFLQTKAKINASIVQHAESGSSPAQTLADKILRQKLSEDELF